MSLISMIEGSAPDGADPLFFYLLISFSKFGAHLKWTMVLGINIKSLRFSGF